MNREDVIRMAREAGIDADANPKAVKALGHSVPLPWLERFAALVAAAERDACAIACEVHATSVIHDGKQPAWAIANECAAAIRARGNQ